MVVVIWGASVLRLFLNATPLLIWKKTNTSTSFFIPILQEREGKLLTKTGILRVLSQNVALDVSEVKRRCCCCLHRLR